MKYLIADGGATKTDWCLAQDGNILARIITLGINPFHSDDEAITKTLTEELIPKLPAEAKGADIFFYGAGCTPEKCITMQALLKRLFPDTKTVQVYSDLVGAARALCGHQPGIACILGTGSNSCFFDGTNVVQNTPPLGYILGDEGSGAVLGKTLVADVLKGLMPQDITEAFFKETGLTKENFLDNIYRKPLPSRFLASMAPFVGNHIDNPAIHELAVRNFRNFFRRNVASYKHPELKVNFIGGLAGAYSKQLAEAAELEGFQVGKIKQSPMEGLLDYHR